MVILRRLTLVLLGVLLVAWTAAFDGNPSAPLPIALSPAYADFDVQVHQRDAFRGTPMQSLDAQHGADCSAPPATHVQPGGVYICKDHLMTALNEEGYGAIYLTPDRMLDFSGPSGGSVTFELSTLRMSTRDWWDITVSPFLDAQALPLRSDLSQGVDLQGPNRNSIVVTTDNGESAPNLNLIRNGSITRFGSAGIPFNSGVTSANPAATRQTFKLTLAFNRARFERIASSTAPALVFFDVALPALSWTQGVVQFGHHSYNPTKDGAGVPATWHWDKFQIDPAIPFYIGHFPTRTTSGGTITADLPAPANAYLRFSAVCKVSVDGVLGTKMVNSGSVEHFSSYLVPVAAGKRTFNVSFAPDGFMNAGIGCMAKDYSIFALTATAPIPTVTPSPSPIPSPSPVPTPSPMLTPSPTPEPSPTATPTPTLTPATYSCVRDDGTIIWQGETNPRSCP